MTKVTEPVWTPPWTLRQTSAVALAVKVKACLPGSAQAGLVLSKARLTKAGISKFLMATPDAYRSSTGVRLNNDIETQESHNALFL
jgi:hypothetical protein